MTKEEKLKHAAKRYGIHRDPSEGSKTFEAEQGYLSGYSAADRDGHAVAFAEWKDERYVLDCDVYVSKLVHDPNNYTLPQLIQIFNDQNK